MQFVQTANQILKQLIEFSKMGVEQYLGEWAIAAHGMYESHQV